MVLISSHLHGTLRSTLLSIAILSLLAPDFARAQNGNPWMPPTHTDRITNAVEPADHGCGLLALLAPFVILGEIGKAVRCKDVAPVCSSSTPAFDQYNNYIGCDICVDGANTCFTSDQIDIMSCVALCNPNPVG